MTSTNDSSVTIQDLKSKIQHFAKEREWEQFHAPKNLSMAIAAEAAELMEHFLWQDGQGSSDMLKDPSKRLEIEDELADVLIFALEFANIADFDVSSIIESKMLKNAQKYPVEKAKGRADKYTEL